MDNNILCQLFGWALAAVTAGAGAYACYRFYACKRGGCSQTSAYEEQLRDECWGTYVELQTIIAFKESCRKSLFGDTGIATALGQLRNILASGRDNAYMAPRITGQVCGFIANALVSRNMVGADGEVGMPDPKPAHMERDVYLRNIAVSPAEQTEKYRKVAEYQHSCIAAESTDTRFADTLRSLLPWLRQAYDIAEGKTVLSPQQTVKWGKDFIDNSSKIIEKYGK